MLSSTEATGAGLVSVQDVVGHFLRCDDAKGGDADVSNEKLQKLLYLAQGNDHAATGKRLFDEDILAYEHGPVVYDVLRTYQGRTGVLVRCGFGPRGTLDLPSEVEDFLGRVWNRWSGPSASALRNLTHGQDPWKDHYVRGEWHLRIPDGALAT